MHRKYLIICKFFYMGIDLVNMKLYNNISQ
nr:MAG TPA: hypothetical protein [Caudoviricetes sp.]